MSKNNDRSKHILSAAAFFFIFSIVNLTANNALADTVPLFTRDLSLGSKGDDVRALQKYLNSHNFPVTSAGSGSLGKESVLFGAKTKLALIKFQNFFANDILLPVGLKKGTGNFFALTRKFINDSLQVPFVTTAPVTTTTIKIISTTIDLAPKPILFKIASSTIFPSVSGGSLNISVSPAPTVPSIIFGSFTKTYNDAPFSLSATSDSDGAFTYLSGNTAVATVSGATTTIVGAGTSTITVTQSASGSFTSASTSVLLTVNQALPVITFNDFSEIFDGESVVVAVSSTSPGSYYFSNSSNVGVAAVASGHTLNLIGPGTTTLILIQNPSDNYDSAVRTAVLTVSSTCATSVCSNYGACTFVGSGEFSCACASGLAGADCSIAVNECLESPCGDHGTCARTSTLGGPVPPLNSHTCTCDSGFSGTACETDNNPEITFNNIIEYFSGTPFDITLSATSTSPGAFSFISSNTSTATISGNTCTILSSGDSTLRANQSASGGFVSGWADAFLTVYRNACQDSPCHNGGACTPNLDSYTCVCTDGFGGSNCDATCGDLTCQNGGVCSESGNSCDCNPCFIGPECADFDVANCA